MRLSGLGAIVALGAMLSLPALAQTAAPAPAQTTKPPVAGTTMTTPPPAATKPMTPAATTTVPAAKPMTPAATTAAPAVKPMTPATTTAAPVTKPVATPLHLDINTASAAELDKIKYVGPKRAAKIIAGRPWKSTDELVAKGVLPRAYYEKIKGNVFVQ